LNDAVKIMGCEQLAMGGPESVAITWFLPTANCEREIDNWQSGSYSILTLTTNPEPATARANPGN